MPATERIWREAVAADDPFFRSNSVRHEDIFLDLRGCVHGFVSECMGVEALIRALGVIQVGFVLVPPSWPASTQEPGPGRAPPQQGTTDRTSLPGNDRVWTTS